MVGLSLRYSSKYSSTSLPSAGSPVVGRGVVAAQAERRTPRAISEARMEDSQILYLTSRALVLVLMLSGPPIIVASVVGVAVSLIQALTQIQEQTLSFAIKLIAVVITIFATAGWLGGMIFEYAVAIFDTFPQLVR